MPVALRKRVEELERLEGLAGKTDEDDIPLVRAKIKELCQGLPPLSPERRAFFDAMSHEELFAFWMREISGLARRPIPLADRSGISIADG